MTLAYDPALRLYQVAGAPTTRFLYDGVDAIAEYDGANALLRRFVFDPTTGQPVLWYEGSGTGSANRRYLSHDERGSIISVSSGGGGMIGINAYDEYGRPGAANMGRYQYTGQKWLPEAGLYDYKSRNYLPQLGIFAQTDPIGYAGGANLYAYVGNDPINWVDPLGLDAICLDCNGPIIVMGIPIGGPGAGRGGISSLERGLQLLFDVVRPRKELQDKQCRRVIGPSPTFMANATNSALGSVPGGGRSAPLSTEFSLITKLPEISMGRWKRVGSSHSQQAFEHSLSGSDKVVKVYIGDRNFNDANTVTITSPTNTFEHYIEFVPYALGQPVNTGNANEYRNDQRGCK